LNVRTGIGCAFEQIVHTYGEDIDYESFKRF